MASIKKHFNNWCHLRVLPGNVVAQWLKKTLRAEDISLLVL